jgi:hypothetical protein
VTQLSVPQGGINIRRAVWMTTRPSKSTLRTRHLPGPRRRLQNRRQPQTTRPTSRCATARPK